MPGGGAIETDADRLTRAAAAEFGSQFGGIGATPEGLVLFLTPGEQAVPTEYMGFPIEERSVPWAELEGHKARALSQWDAIAQEGIEVSLVRIDPAAGTIVVGVYGLTPDIEAALSARLGPGPWTFIDQAPAQPNPGMVVPS